MQDCYKLFNIPPDAKEKAIRRAYRLKAKEVHPDVNKSPEAALQFRLLSEALETLLDPQRRRLHDLHFNYKSRARKKGEQNLYSIKASASERARSTISEWQSSMQVQQQAAQRRTQELQKKYKRKRRNLLILLLVLVWALCGIYFLFF